MKKLFGTDGVRGRVNIHPMTADIALKLGLAAAKIFRNENKKNFKVIIGKDTRLSGYIFEYALTSGLCSMGANVYLVGPMPTPAIAHLTKSFAADAGIVISASHNPAEDNGIKFFDSHGYKLPDDIEKQIEELVFNNHFTFEEVKPDETGKAFKMVEARGRYIEFAKSSINNKSLDGLKIVLDCGNGAAYEVAPLVFSELGAEVIVFGNKPDGLNINKDCGSLFPERLKNEVLINKADIGIALDGDADRVIMVDEDGIEVDGDEIMAICALELKKKDALANNTVVATIMSNLGFEKAMNNFGINVIRAAVGDRYVIDEMRKGGYNLGGEQSGHIIFSDFSTTGDGIISALQIAAIIKESGKKLSVLKKCMTKYPQILINIRVKEKPAIETVVPVRDVIEHCEKELFENGRILVRYSGTENKCRVMVEGSDPKLIKISAEKIADAIKNEIGE
jgi:phosphoglucosamine mutase